MADRRGFMYAGRSVETGPTRDIVRAAQHPYTHGLISSIPSVRTRGNELFQIPGSTPSLLHLPAGCPFRSRCYRATEQCAQDPVLEEAAPRPRVRCWPPAAQPARTSVHSGTSVPARVHPGGRRLPTQPPPPPPPHHPPPPTP